MVFRFNRYLAITARVVRRSLKEQPRLQAERRGEMELRFAKWTVRSSSMFFRNLGPEKSADRECLERQTRRE